MTASPTAAAPTAATPTAAAPTAQRIPIMMCIPLISGRPTHATRQSQEASDDSTKLSYCFMDGTTRQQHKVKTTMDKWTWYANISFVQSTDGDPSAEIRITFKGDGSWSFIGKTALDQTTGPTMQFDRISDDEQTPLAFERGMILHEFGHALGLLHEHQGPAAAHAFKWDRDQVTAWYKSLGWDERFIQDNILSTYSETEVSSYSAFDSRSIMVYRINPEFNSEGLTANINFDLSETDKAYMVINYNRTVPHKSAPQWTLEYALKVAGVPKQVSRRWKTQNLNIRDEFTRYQQAVREETPLLIKFGKPDKFRKGGVYVYRIVCRANLPGFQLHSHVDRQYPQFEKFRGVLSAMEPPVQGIPSLRETSRMVWPCYRRRKLLKWLRTLSRHPEFERIKTEFQRFLQHESY
ncbi:hypothetical protein DFH09DRAFT_1425933 [Mycena vulgaris]|nr:hypothetical protein DFH09DRAFT_1425933 [Mycena vulgaris]